MQRLVPIQPKTSNMLPKFCRSAVVSVDHGRAGRLPGAARVAPSVGLNFHHAEISKDLTPPNLSSSLSPAMIRIKSNALWHCLLAHLRVYLQRIARTDAVRNLSRNCNLSPIRSSLTNRVRFEDEGATPLRGFEVRVTAHINFI